VSVLVVGRSHRSAPVSVLEKVALDSEAVVKLVHDVVESEHVTEATVLSTCNRVEVYADVDRFHGSVEDVSRMILEKADEPVEELLGHLYVHYDDAAVSHLFHVASGLDSMVVGESQILGQAREALRVGQEVGTVGSSLNSLFQQALRVGKRAHAETDIDRAGPSLVAAALERAAEHIGPLAGRRAIVVGAGSMAGLSLATLQRLGVDDVVVANRTDAHGQRLATAYGVRAVELAALPAELAQADLLISCTGATGVVVDGAAVAPRAAADRPLAVIDLALPHDVDPAVADLRGVRLVDLEALAGDLAEADEVSGVEAVREIVSEELAAFLAARRSASVTPTVVALRTMATGVVEAELERLAGRLPHLDDAARGEIELAVRRVADKLLPQPTVRVKALANDAGAISYAAALAELFSLDPDAVDAVTRVEGGGR
jgi:glutamyl-tRNA reductase